MSNETVPKVKADIVYEEEHPVLYEAKDGIAYLTLNRSISSFAVAGALYQSRRLHKYIRVVSPAG